MLRELSKSELIEKIREYEEKLKELNRLKLVEQSIMAGLKEEGFSDRALQYFKYRKNFILENSPLRKNADAIGGFTGACGDHVDIYLKIDGGVIQDAKYMTDGCPGAVTSASAITEMAKGKKLEEAIKLTLRDVIEDLKEGSRGLPRHMYDCCKIAVESLRDAVKQYEKKDK